MEPPVALPRNASVQRRPDAFARRYSGRGRLATLLALFRVFRYLFPLWAALVLYLMVKGFLFSPYQFAGPEAFKIGLLLILGALLAFIGAFWVLKSRRGRLYI
jgi:hypothetical protein